MSLPSQEANICASHIYPVADLGLAVTVTSAATVAGTPFTTGYPATVLVLSSLTSGSGTLKIDVADTAADVSYGSPTASLSCTGTGQQCITVDTNSADCFVGIQQSSGSTAVWNQLVVLALYEMTAGEDWYSVRSGINSVGNDSLGDGAGNVPLGIA